MSCRSSSCALLLLALLALCAASGAVELHAAASLGRRFGGDSRAAATAAAPQGLVVGGRRYRLRLRYTACTGLVNQQYSHIAAFTLAAALGVAEVHLPPAAVRDSFAHKFSIHQEENQILWFAERPECLLDVARLRRSWAALGVTVVEPATLTPFPDLMHAAGAFQLTPLPPGVDWRGVVRVSGLYGAGLELPHLVQRVTAEVERHLGRMGTAFPGLQLDELLLDLPCTFFSLKTAGLLPVVSQVAATLHFAPSLEYLADRVVSYITRDGRRKFNGAHLRVERDAGEWLIILGGAPVVWLMYTETMQDSGFEAGMPLFVATGLLSYGAVREFQAGAALLINSGLCSEVLHKEQYLPPFELQRLNSEQLALLDFLILARAHRFVGFGPSTFSTYLREHRTLHGVPPHLSVLVQAPKIGTEALFAQTAHIAQPQGGNGVAQQQQEQQQQQQKQGAGAVS